jgi:quinol-cytochrome oxidoreductase complex cytochrome b subunit
MAPHRQQVRRQVDDGHHVVIVVTTGRHPWEISGLCIFVIVGLALVAGNPAPPSVDALLPGWFVQFWKAQLAVGAIVALVAVLLPQKTVDRIQLSQVVERTAMILFGVATLVYPAVLAATGQKPALTAIGFATAYGLGALARAWQITLGLRRLRNASREAQP